MGAELSAAVDEYRSRLEICFAYLEPYSGLLDHYVCRSWLCALARLHLCSRLCSSVLLRPLPFRDPDRLVIVHEHFRASWANTPDFSYSPVAPADFYDWRSKTHGFEDMAIMRYAGYNLTGERSELPEAVRAAAGSWNLFPLLGVQPALGRAFTESEDRPGNTVVMLTWSVFQRRFAGDAKIVGRQIHLDGKPYHGRRRAAFMVHLSRCRHPVVGSV